MKTDLSLQDIWSLSEKGIIGKDKVVCRDRHALDVYSR